MHESIILPMQELRDRRQTAKETSQSSTASPIIRFFAMKKYCFYSIMLVLILALELLRLSGGVRSGAEILFFEMFNKSEGNATAQLFA
jgi:hypothetical protein